MVLARVLMNWQSPHCLLCLSTNENKNIHQHLPHSSIVPTGWLWAWESNNKLGKHSLRSTWLRGLRSKACVVILLFVNLCCTSFI